MKLKSIIVAFSVLPVLTACGGGTGPSAIGSKYNPVYTDGEIVTYEALTAEGLTGFVGGEDGSVKEVRVRMDDTGLDPIVYVSIDGGPEIVFDGYDGGSYDGYQGYLYLFNDAAQYAYMDYYGTDAASIELGGEEEVDRDGYFGLETAAAALPTDTVSYYGGWNAYGGSQTTGINASGMMSLSVDFADSSVNGITQGGFDAYNDDLEQETGGNLFGSIEGQVSGSRIDAAMSLYGDATGTMDMKGAFYGDDAQNLAGGVGGSLDTEVGTMSLGGGFWTERSGEPFPPMFETLN
ncbi:hypothetical protein EF888_18760 [Silicimonas algicola]|uniref:Transferrin-binding protein B C-lobe/N-lobe beta-barrel domain-containing protein n=1 Tax=Silicimonas algicola TaxID=1826607 RepID=A0A316G178_9RHOB|nr:transferrin-binding protein-like solute binding protein [Silicimonas algicola]AZQ68991.1 hypothetical protein EF888_18760 [Silicimonas algicola]PWK54125.1 hypothetical protein C8D95_112114 [Silicimonas algicola]